MPSASARPITVALIGDYDLVLLGIEHVFSPYADKIRVAAVDTVRGSDVDVVLYDAFAQPECDQPEIARLVDNWPAQRVVVYTWNQQPELVAAARSWGIPGYLSKSLPARDLVAAIESVHSGREVIGLGTSRTRRASALDWPGRREGITDRESEILALITQGKSNAEVATLTYLSPNTVKSHIRSCYRKIGAASRTQAVLWGIGNGFRPDRRRLDAWLLVS